MTLASGGKVIQLFLWSLTGGKNKLERLSVSIFKVSIIFASKAGVNLCGAHCCASIG
jgi:hypothetical protein